MRSFHVASQRKFVWSSWRGSGQVLLFTYSLVSKISFQHSKNNLTKELRYGLSEANLGLSIIP